MAKTSKSDRAKQTLQRLTEDEEVQAHLRTAATRLREAWARAASRRPSKAVEDKKLYTKIREAATSLTMAVRSLRAQPEPPKRRGLKVTLLAAGGGTAALALKKRQAAKEQSSAEGATSPAAPPPVSPQDHEETVA